jgi:hypothetical protein
LLRWKFGCLSDLKPNGLSGEGKTRKEIPDSYAGPFAAECTVAVEYTTTQERLPEKLKSDYAGLRTSCRAAREIFLCTNRVDFSSLRQLPHHRAECRVRQRFRFQVPSARLAEG